MKAFAKWLMLTLCFFGAAAGGYHTYLESHPKKVLVILDTSFPMGAVWDRVPPLLAAIEKHRYTVFALASDKGPIHGWRPTLELGRAVPYAPRDLKALNQRLQLPELGEATEVTLITNAAPHELPTGTGWKILNL
jgi:hypothetical protein